MTQPFDYKMIDIDSIIDHYREGGREISRLRGEEAMFGEGFYVQYHNGAVLFVPDTLDAVLLLNEPIETEVEGF